MTFKTAVVASVAFMGALIFLLVLTGQANKISGRRRSSGRHRWYAWLLFGTTVGLIFLIEAGIRSRGRIHDELFAIHLSFSLPFLIDQVLLLFFLNGERSKKHAAAAYLLVILYFGTAVTGIPLVLRM